MKDLVKQILKELREEYGDLPTGGLDGTSNMSGTHQQIIKFFKSKDIPPTDEEVHKFAENVGVSYEEFEGHIYMILHSIIKNMPGKHRDIDDSKFNPRELQIGIQIELEHTDNHMLAKEITKDHLSECRNYYTKLLKMEKECED